MSSRATDTSGQWPPIRDTPGGYPATPSDQQNQPLESTPASLSQAVKARKAEYVKKKTIKIKVGTWNVAAINGTEKDLGGWFVDGKGIRGLNELLPNYTEPSESGNRPVGKENKSAQDLETVVDQEERFRKKKSTLPKNDVAAVPAGKDIGIYVLGLQEVVDISSASEALRPYTDPSTAKRWKNALEEALPSGYQKVAEEQLLGLLILVYAAADVAPTIGSVSTTSVGTGLLGYMGNKGAVSVRLVLGETTRLVFVDCHLAAGSDKAALERRNWDATQVVSRTRFDAVTDSSGVSEDFGDGIGDEDFGFWFGDLNYRLEDIPGDDVRRLLLLHTKNEYDLNNKSKRKIDSELGYISARSSTEGTDHPQSDDDLLLDPKSDPASLHTTLQSLLPHDQLRKQQKVRKAFHDGWREGDIDFLPTYKYDVGSVGMFDSGEKKRSPSWCDRILFRTRKDRLHALERIKQEEEDRKRDEEMKVRGIEEASQENDILYDYDPETDALTYDDGDDDGDDEQEQATPEVGDVVETKEGFEDTISLDHYASHQRVLSSDHKPLDAIFTLTYDAVVPELRAKIHQEVAKQLDKAENEGRPTITIVVEHSKEDMPEADKLTDNDLSDTQSINFGEVRYRQWKSRSMTLANTGSVIATVSFIDRPVEEGKKGGKAPPWLSLHVEKASNNANPNPSAVHVYSLEPGETAHVELIVDIDTLKLVHRLNEGVVKLDDVLVLRVNNGRDHFIPVRGHWMQSCLCRSIDDLVVLPEGGIRRKSLLASDKHTGNVAADENTASSGRLSAPRELFALTEGIQEFLTRSLAEWDMTHEASEPRPWTFNEIAFNGWPFSETTRTLTASPHRASLISAVFEALDTGDPLKEHFPEDAPSLLRLEALCEALLIFLSSLQDGIIPPQLWADIDGSLREKEKNKTQNTLDDLQTLILESLSTKPAHNVSFTFLHFLLTRIIHEVVSASQQSVYSGTSGQPSAPKPTADANLQEVNSPTSPSKAASSIFSSLSIRGRRSRTNTLSSTTSSTAETTADSTSTANNAASGPSASGADRRNAMVKAYSTIFADVVIRSCEPASSKQKDKKALLQRKKRVIEAFLQ